MISLFLMRKLWRSIGWRPVPFLLLTYMSWNPWLNILLNSTSYKDKSIFCTNYMALDMPFSFVVYHTLSLSPLLVSIWKLSEFCYCVRVCGLLVLNQSFNCCLIICILKNMSKSLPVFLCLVFQIEILEGKRSWVLRWKIVRAGFCSLEKGQVWSFSDLLHRY